jgi:hypothetical protein
MAIRVVVIGEAGSLGLLWGRCMTATASCWYTRSSERKWKKKRKRGIRCHSITKTIVMI